MRTLRARLIVLVGAILVLVAAGAWLVFTRLARTDVETFLAGEAGDQARSFAPDLAAAYAARGDWADADSLLDRIATTTGRTPVIVTSGDAARVAPRAGVRDARVQRLPGGGVRLAWEQEEGGRVQAALFELRGGVPLLVGDREVGTFHLLPGRPAAGPAAGPGASFAAALGRSAALALGVAALAALLLAAALGRRIVGPIEELTRAVRTFDAGELDARVAVRGDDEIGALAGAFNRMAERRSQAERARRALVGDVAHELRTPLTNLTAQIEAIEDGLAPPDAAALASLHEEVDQLAHLVDDLSELALADEGGLRLALRELVAADELASVRAALEPRALRAGVALELAVEGGTTVFADARRLRQVLRNLLENAIAHTSPGGCIVMGARESASGRVEIVVADDGDGIPPEHLERVFERFHRVDPSRTRATGGRGLGLAIVRQYVEAMGGSVRAESAPGRGTKLLLDLPAGAGSRPRA